MIYSLSKTSRAPPRHTTRVRMVHNFSSVKGEDFECTRGVSVCIFSFWRYTTISTNNKELPINEEIKAPEVRVIGAENEQVGIMKIEEAREYAYAHGVDLVLISPNATPPVCRAIDYGKFCFERDKREKEAKKKQVIVKVKEIQLSCRIEQHDFDFKVKNAKNFLKAGNKVKITLKFKGREAAYAGIAEKVLHNFAEALEDEATVDKAPKLEGRSMIMIVVPK